MPLQFPSHKKQDHKINNYLKREEETNKNAVCNYLIRISMLGKLLVMRIYVFNYTKSIFIARLNASKANSYIANFSSGG